MKLDRTWRRVRSKLAILERRIHQVVESDHTSDKSRLGGIVGRHSSRKQRSKANWWKSKRTVLKFRVVVKWLKCFHCWQIEKSQLSVAAEWSADWRSVANCSRESLKVKANGIWAMAGSTRYGSSGLPSTALCCWSVKHVTEVQNSNLKLQSIANLQVRIIMLKLELRATRWEHILWSQGRIVPS